MRVKIKKVYYCDYCGKHSLLPIHAHERKCTMNIDRICGCCINVKLKLKAIMRLFRARVHREGDWPLNVPVSGEDDKKRRDNLNEIFKDAYDSVDGCPACMLTILRCSGLNKYPTAAVFEFDFKKELEKYWHDNQQ